MADAKPIKAKTSAKAKTTKAAAPTKPAAEATPAAAPPQPVKSSNTKIFVIVGLVVLVFVVIPLIMLLAGGVFLGKKLKDNGVNVNTDTGSVSITDKNGNEFKAGGEQTMPKDFPSEVPVYKGEILSSGRLTVEGRTGWTVTIATSDDLAKVGTSLNDTFSKDGWTTSMSNTTNEGGLVIATKGDLRVNIFYSAQDGKSNILYTVTKETAE